MSVLHLYETFGWWRRRDYLKVHFAESWNEMHHLLIMEVRIFLISSVFMFAHVVVFSLSIAQVIISSLQRSAVETDQQSLECCVQSVLLTPVIFINLLEIPQYMKV